MMNDGLMLLSNADITLLHMAAVTQALKIILARIMTICGCMKPMLTASLHYVSP
jgi:hypothetical protein